MAHTTRRLAIILTAICGSWLSFTVGPAYGQLSSERLQFDVRMVASVQPSCALRTSGGMVRIEGTTSAGDLVNISLAGGDSIAIDCNTPYAMSLRQVGFTGGGGARSARAGVPPSVAAGQASDITTGSIQPPTGERVAQFEALAVQILERNLTAGEIVSINARCPLAAGQVCTLVPESGGPTDAPLRGVLRFAAVRRQQQDAPASMPSVNGAATGLSEARDAEERKAASLPVGQGESSIISGSIDPEAVAPPPADAGIVGAPASRKAARNSQEHARRVHQRHGPLHINLSVTGRL